MPHQSIALVPTLIALLASFLLVPASHAQDAEQVPLWSEEISPEINSLPRPSARGVVHTVERWVDVPDALPPETRLWLAGSADGRVPLHADDKLRVHFSNDQGAYEWEHDFRRADRRGLDPYGPVDLTDHLPSGDLSVTLTVLDLDPPLAGESAVYLVALVPPAVAASASSLSRGALEATEESRPYQFPRIQWEMIPFLFLMSLAMTVLLRGDG
jgi:hypothetical protein